MTVIDFAHARRTRGLYALAGPGRLDRPSAHALRHWRCYHARLTQRDAARAAGVTLRQWVAAETGRTVPPGVLAAVWSLGQGGVSCSADNARTAP